MDLIRKAKPYFGEDFADEYMRDNYVKVDGVGRLSEIEFPYLFCGEGKKEIMLSKLIHTFFSLLSTSFNRHYWVRIWLSHIYTFLVAVNFSVKIR